MKQVLLKIKNVFSGMKGPSAFLQVAFSLLFFCVMCAHLLLLGKSSKVSTLLPACFVVAALLFMVCLLPARFMALSSKTFNKILVFVMCIYLAFSFYVGNAAKTGLPSDTEVVYMAAAALLESGNLEQENLYLQEVYKDLGVYTNADYFCRSPNNITLLLLLAATYKIGGFFGVSAATVGGLWLGILLAAVFNTLALLFTVLLVRRALQSNCVALLTALLWAAFTPFYYSLPNFYTDILILFPAVAGLYAFAATWGKKQPFWLALPAAIFAFAVQLKITAAAVVFAVLIFVALQITKENAAIALKRTAVFLTVFFVLQIGFSAWYHQSNWFNFTRESELSLPVAHFVHLGSHGTGSWVWEDAYLAYSTKDPEERSSVVWNAVLENYKTRSFAEQLQFMRQKMVYTWGDAHFDGSIYTQWPYENNWTNYFTLPVNNGYKVLNVYGKGINYALYIFTWLASLFCICRPKMNLLWLSNLCIFGVMLYLQIFETAPRRALIAAPFLIINAVLVCAEVRPLLKNTALIKLRKS